MNMEVTQNTMNNSEPYAFYISKAIKLPASSGMSDVHSVRLSLSSCMIKVLSLYDSSFKVSSSEIASSKACFARWHALEQFDKAVEIHKSDWMLFDLFQINIMAQKTDLSGEFKIS